MWAATHGGAIASALVLVRSRRPFGGAPMSGPAGSPRPDPDHPARRDVVAASVAGAVLGLALVLGAAVLVGGDPIEPQTGVLLGIAAVAAVAAVGELVAVAARRSSASRRSSAARREADRTAPPRRESPPEPVRVDDAPIDLTDAVDPLANAVDPLEPIPDDRAVLDADASDIDLTRGPTVRVVLHPGPVTRRRLDGRPDALVVVADAEALDVPGWILEDRSRVIDRTDRVVIPWASIERFRVRAEGGGPQVYDITARPDAPPPRRWRVRRDEIADELELLDHVRRIGRITIELEDSIRS